MKRCYGYVRVSTVKQGVQGVSLQEQREAILRYCSIHKIEIISWFEERETAAKRGRPVFSKMLSLLKQGKAEGLVIHKIDRSARNLRDWASLGDLIDRDVEVHFVSESLDLKSRGGRLSADIQAVVAADFIRNLREETRKGFYGRLKQGLYPIAAPVGYVDNGRGNPKTLDPVMAPLVREVFERYADGKLTINQAVEEYYQRGLRNKRGGKVTSNGVSRMLNNPFYTGLILLRSTGEVFEGVHEPLISTALFGAVQDRLKGRRVRRVKRHDFLFSRTIRCGQCGNSLIGERQKGYIYYRCHANACRGTSVREEKVDDAVRQALRPLKARKEEAELFQLVAEDYLSCWEECQTASLQSLRLRAAQIAERLTRLTDAFLDQHIEKDLFEERKALLYKERLDINDRIRQIEAGEHSAERQIREFLELLKSAYIKYEMGIPAEKRDVINSVTSNCTVHRKNVVVELDYLFRRAADRPKCSQGDPYRDRPRTFMKKLLDEVLRKTSPQDGAGKG